MRSIRGKVLVSILLITLITSAAITAVFYQKSARMIEDNYVSTLRQRGDQLIDNMDQLMQEIYHITVSASCNQELKETLKRFDKNQEEQELENLADLLSGFRRQNTSISSVYLLIPKEGILVTSQDYPLYRKGIEEEASEMAAGLSKTIAGPVIMEDMLHEDLKLFSFIETVEDEDGNTAAYLLSNIEERVLYYGYMADLEGGEIEEAVILDDKNRIVTMLGEVQIGREYGEAGSYSSWLAEKPVQDSFADAIHVYSEAVFSECSLYMTVERSVVLKELKEMRSYFFGILAVLILLSLLPAYYLTRMISRPVKELMTVMQKVSEGDLETRAEVVSQDEIGTLAGEFNQMLEQIEQLIQQVIEEENLKKDAELEALQYQITPHFMYNTLNSIKYSALIKGETEIGGLIGDFVELLQASISKKGAFLTVAEEVHILKNYIHLQEFRYGGCFCVRYEITPESEGCLIPRLLLQPLVENALLHGMDIKEKNGELLIKSGLENGVLVLTVADNGRGMTEEQIYELLNGRSRKTSGLTAIGIPNIRDRLKLYYRENAGIAFESDGHGTTAEIHLPAHKGEE